jgi:glucosylceramidase
MKGGPNHVGNYCDAPILADEREGSLHFQSSYYYIGHFSRFIKPEAVRISSDFFSWMTPATVSGHLTDEAETIAFKNPDGSIALVVTNRTEADLVFEFKIETADGSQTADLRDWEKARTAANSDSKDKKDAAAPLYLKCPPRAIQTWIIK